MLIKASWYQPVKDKFIGIPLNESITGPGGCGIEQIELTIAHSESRCVIRGPRNPGGLRCLELLNQHSIWPPSFPTWAPIVCQSMTKVSNLLALEGQVEDSTGGLAAHALVLVDPNAVKDTSKEPKRKKSRIMPALEYDRMPKPTPAAPTGHSVLTPLHAECMSHATPLA